MAESIDIRELNIRIEQQSQFVTNLVIGMNKVIVGQKHLVDCLLIGLLSDGHILSALTSAAFSLLPTCCLPTWWVHRFILRRTRPSM